jgi:hypothetical protein
MHIFNLFRCLLHSVLASLLCATLIGQSARAAPIEPPPTELNALIMLEKQAEDISTLNWLFGVDPYSSFDYTGSFDAAGWQLATTGTYFGESVSINYTGTYNPKGTMDPDFDVVAWDLFGNAFGGDLSFSGSGSATIVNDWLWESPSFWILAATLAVDVLIVGTEVFVPGAQTLGAVSVKAIAAVTKTGLKSAAAVSIVELGGGTVKEAFAEEVITPSPDGDPNTPPRTQRRFIVTSEGNRSGNTITGQTRVSVPEPSSLGLIIIGILVLARSVVVRKLPLARASYGTAT